MNSHYAPMHYTQRLKAARHELETWRETHPKFTTKELLDTWMTIRQKWKLMETQP